MRVNSSINEALTLEKIVAALIQSVQHGRENVKSKE